MKRKILLFGANSFIAKSYISDYSDMHDIVPVYRTEGAHNGMVFDFNKPESVNGFAASIDFQVDGVFFLQGINPSMGVKDITADHFEKMLRVNLVTPVLLLAALKNKMSSNALVIFFSSVAKRKGSYDPSYGAAKSALTGLVHSLQRGYPDTRFNTISLGLVEGSPVFRQMTDDFREKHAARMQHGSFIKAENVTAVMDMLLNNTNINAADIPIDGGYN